MFKVPLPIVKEEAFKLAGAVPKLPIAEICKTPLVIVVVP